MLFSGDRSEAEREGQPSVVIEHTAWAGAKVHHAKCNTPDGQIFVQNMHASHFAPPRNADDGRAGWTALAARGGGQEGERSGRKVVGRIGQILRSCEKCSLILDS